MSCKWAGAAISCCCTRCCRTAPPSTASHRVSPTSGASGWSTGLASIRNPTLVVVGLRDTATPPALSYELANGIAGAKLIELPHCGHSPHIQDPDGFWQAIKPFLKLDQGRLR